MKKSFWVIKLRDVVFTDGQDADVRHHKWVGKYLSTATITDPTDIDESDTGHCSLGELHLEQGWWFGEIDRADRFSVENGDGRCVEGGSLRDAFDTINFLHAWQVQRMPWDHVWYDLVPVMVTVEADE